ncbi:MAG TPA: PH domain-containing protein [Streptosporangiaceae bacterium]|nr:PH domain-containing protein [Streptosporangiaceae bacterium]
MTAGPAAPADLSWHRLHPLSPVVRSGRGVIAVLAVLGISRSAAGGGGSRWVDLGIAIAAALAAVISWLVTRWRLDGETLRIESGLLRRDSRQLPIARIQAVDVVRPFLARALGLAELRVRLAGSSHADGRLAYLTEQGALDLRARLLAAHHGVDPDTPAPAEQIAVVVPTGRLAASVLLSASGGALVAVLAGAVAAVVVALTSPVGLAALAVAVVWWVLIGVSLLWRRVSSQYGFTVAQSPDGIRIRRGLLGTVAETIPVPRVQAVRMIEPLLWRPLGWCRLEVDVAGSPGRDVADGTARARKTLLPVGHHDQARYLLALALPVTAGPGPGLIRPPRQARWKAPLSYHFLAAGHDHAIAVAVTGRLRKVTTWVPLAKAQSVRYVQGPVQRWLGLATVHLDAAGHHVRAEFRERPQPQARLLVDELAALGRAARRAGPQAASVASPVNAAQSEA